MERGVAQSTHAIYKGEDHGREKEHQVHTCSHWVEPKPHGQPRTVAEICWQIQHTCLWTFWCVESAMDSASSPCDPPRSWQSPSDDDVAWLRAGLWRPSIHWASAFPLSSSYLCSGFSLLTELMLSPQGCYELISGPMDRHAWGVAWFGFAILCWTVSSLSTFYFRKGQ